MKGKKENKENSELSAFDKLKDKQKLFVKYYIKHFAVAYKAYKEIHPNVDNNVAMVEASRLLRNPNIKAAIAEEYQKIYSEIQSDIEKSKTYQLIHALGNSDISDVVDLENGTLTVKDLKDIPIDALQTILAIEFTEKETAQGIDKNIKVRLQPKLQALELRAKIQKLISVSEDNKLEIIVKPAVWPQDILDKVKSEE